MIYGFQMFFETPAYRFTRIFAMIIPLFLTISVFLCFSNACPVSMDLVIAVDASGSVGHSNFISCLEFVKSIVGAFDTDTGNIRVGMMTFDHTSNIIYHLNANMKNSDMKTVIENTTYTGRGTDIKGALETIIDKMFVEEKGDRPGIRNAIFLVTDGRSRDPIPAAETAHRQGITIYVLGVGSGTSQAQLEGMASKPTTDHLFQKSSFDELSDYGSMVAGQICQACPVSMDLVIAVDASEHIGHSDFISCLEFVKSFVSSFDTDTGNIRVGMMTFDSTSNIIFHLNANMKNSQMKSVIGNTTYTSGGTDIEEALEAIIDKMFVEEKGDRRDIRNAIFLVTDKNSSRDPIPAAETAHRQGITIYILGVGSGTSQAQFEGMASKPTTAHLFQKSSFDELSDYGSVVAGKICQVQGAREPTSCSMGEKERFCLKRGYMLPFENGTRITNLRHLNDCISLCIDHFIVSPKCEAFNFCKNDNTLGGTCQMTVLSEKWEMKLVPNSTCVFGKSPRRTDIIYSMYCRNVIKIGLKDG